jgi:membrane-associated phospholipid phosphatase
MQRSAGHRRTIFAAAALVSASRVFIGAHYVSDVLFGFAIGLTIVVVVQNVFGLSGIELEDPIPKQE